MENYNRYAIEWYKLNKEGCSLREIGRRYNVSHKKVSQVLRKHLLPIKEQKSGKFQDITNVKFGLITAVEVIEKSVKNSKGALHWRCFCACNPNKPLEILGTDLRRRKRHCGCNNPLKSDISGKPFGLLTAIRDSRIRICDHVIWECICQCSEKTLVSYGDLTSGHTKSCGCQRPKGENHYKWNGGSEVKRFLRGHLKTWKNESFASCHYKCVISGVKKQLEIHHLSKSFNEIYIEALSHCNLQQLSSIGGYSAEELDSLIEYVISLHYQYGLGVAITRDLHNEFHSLFGYNCTKENFEEFVQLKKVITP